MSSSPNTRSRRRRTSNDETSHETATNINGRRAVRSSRQKNFKYNEDSDNESQSESKSSKSTIKATAIQEKSKSQPNGTNKLDPNTLLKLESITGLSRTEAIELFEASDYSLERAVDLYFNTNQVNSDSSSSSKTASKSKATNKRSYTEDTDVYDSADFSSDDNKKRTVKAQSTSASTVIDYDDNVRAPIPQKSEKLIDYDPYAVNLQPQNKRMRGAFDGFRNLKEEYDEYTNSAATNNTSSKAKTLSSIFRPPIDLIFVGSFESAKNQGCKVNKWLLLNVQNPSDFECQCLNRDIWSDETVKEIIKANFVFSQIYFDSPEGKKLIHYYNIDTYPFLAIIDPRTGEKMTQMNCMKLDAWMFCEKATNFLCDHEAPMSNEEHEAALRASSNTEEKKEGEVIESNDKQENEAKKATRNGSINYSESKLYPSNDLTPKKSSQKAKRAADIIQNICTNGIHKNQKEEEEEEEEEEIKPKPILNGHHKTTNGHNLNQRKEEKKEIKKEVKKEVEEEAEDAEISIIEEPRELVKETRPNYFEQQDVTLKDCFLRVLLPDGQRLDLNVNGDATLNALVDILAKKGYRRRTHSLVERMMMTDKDYSEIQSRNLLKETRSKTFKELNLFPRVFLMVQEL